MKRRVSIALTRAAIHQERRWTLMPHGVRLGRTLGVLAIIAGVIGLVALPFLTEVTLGSFPLLLVLLALLGGVLLVTAPTAFLEGIPPAALTAWAMINQAAFAWTTGDADSPFLPGFTVIVAAVAASSTVRLTVFAVALAAAGFLAIGLADVVLSAADMVRIVVDAVVLMTVGITVSRLAWRRRVEVSRAVARLDRARTARLALRVASETDPLTGVGNRRAFEDAIARLAQTGGSEGVMLLLADADGLKKVNDRLGHEAGDAMLRGIADGLRRQLRPQDRLYRIGGDEFAAILEPTAVEGVERRFGGTLRVDVEGIGPVSASVGVAALPDAPDPHAVLRLADEEMYSRKASSAKRGSRRVSRRATTAT